MEGICSMNDIVINLKDSKKKFEKYKVLNISLIPITIINKN